MQITCSELRELMKDQDMIYNKRERALLENCVLTKKIHDIMLETNHSLETICDRATETPFVAVFIDGHDFMFHPDYVRQGLKGGRLIGQHLIDRVHKYLQDCNYEDHTRWRIMVRVVADIDDWEYKLEQYGYHMDRTFIEAFGVGVTQAQALVNFFYIRGGKKITDVNLSKELRCYLPSVGDQCKHVILGCSNDHGMLELLKPYEDDVR